MGQVHAREPRRGYHEDAAAEDGDDDLGVDLGSIGVRVTKVHLKGLQRTKDDMVVASIEPVLKVKQVCGIRRCNVTCIALHLAKFDTTVIIIWLQRNFFLNITFDVRHVFKVF